MNFATSAWFSITSSILLYLATHTAAANGLSMERVLISGAASTLENCANYNGGCATSESNTPITGPCKIIVRDCDDDIFNAGDISSVAAWNSVSESTGPKPIVQVIVDKDSGSFKTFHVDNVYSGGYIIISEDSSVEKVTFGSIIGGSILAEGADAVGEKVVNDDEKKGKLAVRTAIVNEVSNAYVDMYGNGSSIKKVHIGSVYNSGTVSISEDSSIEKLTFDEIHSYGRIVAPAVYASGKKVYNDGCLAAFERTKGLVTMNGGVSTHDESECPTHQEADNTCGYEKGCSWDHISDDCTLTVRECYEDTFQIGTISDGAKLIVDRHSGYMEALVTGDISNNSEVDISRSPNLVSTSFDSIADDAKLIIKSNRNLVSVFAGSVSGGEVTIVDNKNLESIMPASLLGGKNEALIGTRVAYDSISDEKRQSLRGSS